MLPTPSKSLAAASSEDIAKLIQIGRSEDPGTALEDYINEHKRWVETEKYLTECSLTSHESLVNHASNCFELHQIFKGRFDLINAASSEGGQTSPSRNLKQTQLKMERHDWLGRIANLATKFVVDNYCDAITKAEYHARQTKIVQSDLDLVLKLASHYHLSPEQITHLIAIKADQISMYDSSTPAFSDPSDDQLSGLETRSQTLRLVFVNPREGSDPAESVNQQE